MKEIKLTDSLANPPTEEALAKPVAQQAEANLMQLEVVHQEPKEIVDNEENVLEENRRAPLAGAKDFKVCAVLTVVRVLCTVWHALVIPLLSSVP